VSVLIRPFSEPDYPAIVHIFNACEPDVPWSEADARARDETWDYSRYVRLRHVAELDVPAGGSDGGERTVVGYGQISHQPFAYHPRKFTIHVMVHPHHRRRGAGTALYQQLVQELTARDALLARCDLAATHSETIDFIAKRGFVEVARYWESRLDLPSFESARFADLPERESGLQAAGILLRTVAQARDTISDLARLVYDLHDRAGEGEPTLDERTMPPFERWRVRNIDSPDLLAGASFLALDAASGDPVAMTFLYRTSDPGIVQQSFTGTLPSHRGRGIARTLKLAAIRAARDAGFREIRTENDSLNRPMLHINEALGFQKQPPSITFEKRFNRGEGDPPQKS
jgi:GNAT superfamily N-acetyltransferase